MGDCKGFLCYFINLIFISVPFMFQVIDSPYALGVKYPYDTPRFPLTLTYKKIKI
jgi:hypothetical protein